MAAVRPLHQFSLSSGVSRQHRIVDVGQIGAKQGRLRHHPDKPAKLGLQHVAEISLVEDVDFFHVLIFTALVWKTSDGGPWVLSTGGTPPPVTAVTKFPLMVCNAKVPSVCCSSVNFSIGFRSKLVGAPMNSPF